MFDSGIPFRRIVEELKNEVDVAIPISNENYVEWMNSLHQLLYTEVIKEQKKVTIMTSNQNVINLSSIYIESDKESQPRFEDIHAIYADGVQLMKSTVASGVVFPNTFYKDNNNIGYNTKNTPQELTIVYMVRPSLYGVVANEGDYIIAGGTTNVMVPAEFIDLVKAKLRGEAYKLANEAELSAMWLNDYNILLETFKAWIADKSPNFGL